jgi:hypothetical protein
MKFSGRQTVWILLVQATSTGAFQPSGLLSTLPKPSLRLNAVDGDIADIVKAYRKAQPPPSSPVESTPSNLLHVLGSTTPDIPPVATITPDPPAIPSIPIISAPASLPGVSTDPETVKPMMGYVDDFIKQSQENYASKASTNPETVKPAMGYVDDFIKHSQANYASRAAVVVDSPRSPGSVPTLADFFKGGIQKSTVTETMSLPGHKVPPLVGYFKSVLTGDGSMSPQEGSPTLDERLVTVKTNVGLMFQNTWHLVHKEAPGGLKLDIDTSGLPDDLSDKYVIGWGIAATAILVAAGARRSGQTDAVLVAAGARRSGQTDAKMAIEEASGGSVVAVEASEGPVAVEAKKGPVAVEAKKGPVAVESLLKSKDLVCFWWFASLERPYGCFVWLISYFLFSVG